MRLGLQVPSNMLYLVVNVWTLTGRCRLHGALIDWFRCRQTMIVSSSGMFTSISGRELMPSPLQLRCVEHNGINSRSASCPCALRMPFAK